MLYNENITNGLDGIYDPYNRFYCVWTANSSAEEIASADTHGKCHALVLSTTEQYNHFCVARGNPNEWTSKNIRW